MSLPPSEEPLPRVSRHQKPDHLSLEDWQVALRKSYARRQHFEIENIGSHPVFSEFAVSNPESGSEYRVAIRGTDIGVNFCSCPDFATNHLGTCKHIEWTLLHLEQEEGADALLKPWTPPYSEVYLQYGPRRCVRFQHGTQCSYDLLDLSQEYFDAAGVLKPEAVGSIDRFLEHASRSDHEFRCYDDTLGFLQELRERDDRARLVEETFPDGAASGELDSLLKLPLYPYQRTAALFALRAGRCLIGDEMGLGKTVEAIAAAELMARHLGVESVLVVCPQPLKYQWSKEIARFSDRPCVVVDGGPDDRAATYESSAFFRVTNYDVIHSDLDAIAAVGFDLVILDEAQRIKNWETRTSRSVKQIASPYAVVLTGTPLENRLEELVSLVQFIDQFRLGPTYKFLHEHQKRNASGRVVGYRKLDEVSETLAPILLRRKKSDVLDQLPERLEKPYYLPMTQPQHALHDRHRDQAIRQLDRWRRTGKLPSDSERRQVLASVNAMRMACDSTWLLDQTSDHSVKVTELLTVLGELLEEEDVKVVVFSEWTKMLRLVASELEQRGYRFRLFHGGLSAEEKAHLVEEFTTDPELRILLSTDSGGVGLNLQAASVVVNLDIPWTPAKLEQRVGRVHRVGQTQPVRVIDFITARSVESALYDAYDEKQALADSVLDAKAGEIDIDPDSVQTFLRTVDRLTGRLLPSDFASPPKAARETGADEKFAQESMSDLLARAQAVIREKRSAQASAKYATFRDPQTGETVVTLRVQDADELRRQAEEVSRLIGENPLPPERASDPAGGAADERDG